MKNLNKLYLKNNELLKWFKIPNTQTFSAKNARGTENVHKKFHLLSNLHCNGTLGGVNACEREVKKYMYIFGGSSTM